MLPSLLEHQPHRPPTRTREAIRSRVKAGKVAGGACCGYSLQKLPDGTTVAFINEAEAEVVRRIFGLFVSGYGLKRIAVLLNDEQVASPKAGRRGSGSWSDGSIRAIVRRERYRGMYVHGVVNRKKRGGKRIKVFADDADVLRLEIPEGRIVDDLTLEACAASHRGARDRADRRGESSAVLVLRLGAMRGVRRRHLDRAQ